MVVRRRTATRAYITATCCPERGRSAERPLRRRWPVWFNSRVDREAVREALDEQLRRNPAALWPGERVERDGRVVRFISPGGLERGAVERPRRGERRRRDRLAGREVLAPPRPWEWKHYSHDAAGRPPGPPPVRRASRRKSRRRCWSARSPACRLACRRPAWGSRLGWCATGPQWSASKRCTTRCSAARAPGSAGCCSPTWASSARGHGAFLAMAGAVPGRRRAHGIRPGNGLRRCSTARAPWRAGAAAGSFIPSWRCAVAAAAERGFRYIQTDALPDSRPILKRLGFVELGTTTPFIHPGGQVA